MRVLVVSHTYISPINRDKWKVMAQSHPDVTLKVVFPQRWPTCLFNHEAYIAEHENSANCIFHVLPTSHEGNELLYYYHHKQLYQLIKDFKPDLVHVEQGDGALSYFQINIYLKMLKLKSRSVFFTWINWTPKHSLKSRVVLGPIQKINLTCAHGAIAGNHDAANILQQKGFTKPIIVLPQLGINTAVFRPVLPAGSTKYISFIGRLIEEKGIFLLLNVFYKISSTFHDWNLLIMGTGPALNTIRNFIASKQLHHRISLFAPVPHEQVAFYVQNSSILVLPSYDTPTWREQFGHILIEAMSCGTPIIGSTAGEIPHVIDNAGLIFEQKNEQSLLAQLQTLMQDEELRKRLGALGYQRAHTMFSHAAIADQTYDFWQKIM